MFFTGQGGIGEPCVTKLVYQRCISEICEWIDVEAMVPQLMQYSIITTQDDIHVITHGLPSQRRNYLYSKLCGSKNGFQLFYRCLRESQSNQLGHKDAADKLEEIGILYMHVRSLCSLTFLSFSLFSSKVWTGLCTSVLPVIHRFPLTPPL